MCTDGFASLMIEISGFLRRLAERKLRLCGDWAGPGGGWAGPGGGWVGLVGAGLGLEGGGSGLGGAGLGLVGVGPGLEGVGPRLERRRAHVRSLGTVNISQ